MTDASSSVPCRMQPLVTKSKVTGKPSRLRDEGHGCLSGSYRSASYKISKGTPTTKTAALKQTLTRVLQREKIAVVRRDGRMIIRIFKVTEPGDGEANEAMAESEMVKGVRAQIRKLSLVEDGVRREGHEDQVVASPRFLRCFSYPHLADYLPVAAAPGGGLG